MNYAVIRLLSVGAWALVYFHVLCSLLSCNGVMGDVIPSKTKIRTIQQQYFEELKSENDNNNIIDDTVVGWLTGDYTLKARNILDNLWKDENQFFRDTFYHRTLPPQYFTDDILEESSQFDMSNSVESDTPCPDESHVRVKDNFESVGCRHIETEHTLVCDNSSLTNLPELPPYLKLFELNLTNIRDLSRGAFGQVIIENMKIEANTQLRCIHPYAFEGVTGLKTLRVTYNSMEMVRLEDFKTLNETYFMYLEHNKINLNTYDGDETTPPSTGGGYGDIDQNNHNHNIDSEPVLPSLAILSLMGNPLIRIPARYFYALRESPLTTLSLVSCQLHEIHEEAFTYLYKLGDLDLSENPRLMNKLDKAFTGVTATMMHTLKLSNNYMVTVPSAELDRLTHLETLDLHGNLFDTLMKGCFGSIVYQNLKSLNLNNCRIRSIQEGTFLQFLKLETLTLNNNRLATIPPSISHLSGLKTLELSANVPADNTIASINGEFGNKLFFKINPPLFSNMTNLEYLSLDSLPLPRIEKSTFRGLVNLRYLSVSDTSTLKNDEPLYHIADHAFQDMGHLKILRLENNKLTEITQLTFSGLDSVDNLLLDNNHIDLPDLSESVISPIKSSVQSGDPFIGGIKIEPFKNLPKLKWLHMANNKIRYIDASIFKGLSNLEEVDLRENSIHSWSERVFVKNVLLEKLFLGHNNIGPITSDMLDDFLSLHFGEPVTGVDHNLDISNNPLVCSENICEIAKRASDRSLRLENWFESGYHTCLDTNTNKYYNMKTLNFSSDICMGKPGIGDNNETTIMTTTDLPITITTESLADPKGIPPDQKTNVSSFGTTFAIIFLSVCFVSSVGVIGYKKRFHLKYFWFVVKFNVVNLPDLNIVGKRRGSIPSYEYDIFVSYNHTDRGFIEDYLVVQIEDFPHNNNINNSDDNNASGEKTSDNDDVESCRSGSSGSSDSSSKLKVCIHERDFKAGVPITDNIVDFVDRSRKVVVVVSKNYLESQWCLYEMNLAYHRLIESGRRSFLVILLEDIPATLRTKSLNYLLLSRTYLEWPGSQASVADQNLFWKRLKNSLCQPSQ